MAVPSVCCRSWRTDARPGIFSARFMTRRQVNQEKTARLEAARAGKQGLPALFFEPQYAYSAAKRALPRFRSQHQSRPESSSSAAKKQPI